MILPGTKYIIISDINKLGSFGLKGQEFWISLTSDPRMKKVSIHINDSEETLFLNHNEIENCCKLLSDFGEAIYFYTPLDRYGMLSNFSEYGVTVKGLYYQTVEHYYQASKFQNQVYREQIRLCKTPKRASELGKSKEQLLKLNWNVIKTEIMLEAIRYKFTQNKTIRTMLLNTGNKLLIENSPYDNFWGIGRTGEGMNYLGTILMQVRKEIQTTENQLK